MTRACAAFSYLFVALSAWCLDPSTPVNRYGHASWGSDEGLPQETVLAIRQASDGYLWLGTQGGLVRFDGVRFAAFTQHDNGLAGDNVYALSETKDHILWIGTSKGGLTRWQGGQATVFGQAQGLKTDNIRALAEEASGRLWIGTIGGGVAEYSNGVFRNYGPEDGLPSANTSCLLIDHEQGLWLGTFDSGIAVRKGDRFVRSAGGPPGLVWSMAEDRKGRIWAATLDGLWRRQDGYWSHLSVAEGGLREAVRTLMFDRAGSLWIGLVRGGLARWAQQGLERFTAAKGLSDNTVLALTEDREGNLWVATGAGLDRFKEEKFRTCDSRDRFNTEAAGPLYEDRTGALWAGTASGSIYRKTASGSFARVKVPEGGRAILAIFEDKRGRRWIGSAGGFVTMQEPNKRLVQTQISQGGKFSEIAALGEDARGVILAATLGSGLLCWKDGRWSAYLVASRPALKYLTSVAQDRQVNLWMSTYDSGIGKLSPGGQITLWSIREGLPSAGVRTLCVDASDEVWLAMMDGGLVYGRAGHFTSWRWPGCPLDSPILGIINDGLGFLWLSTTQGIVRVNREQLKRALLDRAGAPPMNLYRHSDGIRRMLHPSYLQPVSLRSRDGWLWFCTARGLAAIEPHRIKLNREPPPVAIERVTVSSHEVSPGPNLMLSPDSERLEIAYTGLSLSAPEGVRFGYRLEGYEKDWVVAGSARLASYTHLPPGRYRFHVAAANADGCWNWRGASLSFKPAPHIWQTWWFSFGWGILLLGTGRFLYRARLRNTENRFSKILVERARMAHEINDTLLQGFAGVTLLMESAAQRMPVIPEDARQPLERALAEADRSLTRARSAVWDMRSLLPRGVDLPTALRAAGRQCGESNVHFKLKVHGDRRLNATFENNLFRIAEEALINAVRHARPSSITVDLSLGKRVRMTVTDDGCGFTPEHDFSHYGGRWGLLCMRERAEQIGAQLGVISQPGHGTRITVECSASGEDLGSQ